MPGAEGPADLVAGECGHRSLLLQAYWKHLSAPSRYVYLDAHKGFFRAAGYRSAGVPASRAGRDRLVPLASQGLRSDSGNNDETLLRRPGSPVQKDSFHQRAASNAGHTTKPCKTPQNCPASNPHPSCCQGSGTRTAWPPPRASTASGDPGVGTPRPRLRGESGSAEHPRQPSANPTSGSFGRWRGDLGQLVGFNSRQVSTAQMGLENRFSCKEGDKGRKIEASHSSETCNLLPPKSTPWPPHADQLGFLYPKLQQVNSTEEFRGTRKKGLI